MRNDTAVGQPWSAISAELPQNAARVARQLLGFLAVCLLASCTSTVEPQGLLGRLWHLEVGPDYKRPAVAPPEQFRGQIQPSEATSLADLAWWEVFGDVHLQQLISEALANNYDLQRAAARVEESRALIGVAASPLFPQVGYLGAASREKILVSFGDSPNTTLNVFTGLFNVAWEVDVWGRIRHLSLLRYDTGRATYFEVLEAEQQLYPAEDALAQTQRDQLLAVVDLYKALGGGWQLTDAQFSRVA